MQEYKNRFIWNNYINSLKINADDFFDCNLDGMSIDSGDENILGQYNPLYDTDIFLEENDMNLDE